jgi:hypothetical protein
VAHIASFVDLSEMDRAAWLDLVERSPRCSVELHPDVAVASARSRGRPLIYAEREGSTLTTIAVLVPKVVRSLRHPRLAWLGRLQGYRLAGNQLAGNTDRDAADRFLDAVERHLGAGHADCILVEDLDVSTPLWQAANGRASEAGLYVGHPGGPQPRWYIHFSAPASSYWHGISGQTRYQARRAARRLPHVVRRFSTPADVDTFLACTAHVSPRSWQGQRLGLRLGLGESFRAHFTALARLGALRAYVLYHQDQPAAFLYGWQWNGYFAYEEVAYDSALAAFSPGRVLLHRVIEDLIADRCPEVLDFGCGDARYKRSFGNHESASGPLVLAPRGVKTQLWSGLRQTSSAVDRGMRELLQRTGLYEHARRMYRHGCVG